MGTVWVRTCDVMVIFEYTFEKQHVCKDSFDIIFSGAKFLYEVVTDKCQNVLENVPAAHAVFATPASWKASETTALALAGPLSGSIMLSMS